MDKCCPSIHWRGGRAGEAVESMFLSPQTRKPICDKWVNSKGLIIGLTLPCYIQIGGNFFNPHSVGTVTVMRGIFNALSVHLGVCTTNNQRGLYPSMYAIECTWPPPPSPPRPSGCQSMERCNGNVEKDGEETNERSR